MGMVDFKTRDRTHMYVTTHDTAKFCLLTYILYCLRQTTQLAVPCSCSENVA